jgi:hypothetical protein
MGYTVFTQGSDGAILKWLHAKDIVRKILCFTTCYQVYMLTDHNLQNIKYIKNYIIINNLHRHNILNSNQCSHDLNLFCCE